MLDQTADSPARSVMQTSSRAATALMPLQATGLSLTIGNRRILDDIDLTLFGGTLTVVMGPNGAGKSLLLQLLHGLRAPSGGMIHWGGMPMSERVRRRQAMVFQKSVLLRRSVAANIDFVLSLRGPGDRKRRNEILEDVNLLDCAGQPARLLSGGEQQRLALGRALAMDPAVLFLDEPTASLDPTSTLLIEQIVLDVHRRGTKIIFVTHDIGQARRLADDVVFLHRGRLVEHTPTGRFFSTPSSDAARAFLDGRIVL